MEKSNSSDIANQTEETNWTDFMNLLYVNRGKVAWLTGVIIAVAFVGYNAGRLHERYVADKELMHIQRDHDKEVQRMTNDMLLIRIESRKESRVIQETQGPYDEQ